MTTIPLLLTLLCTFPAEHTPQQLLPIEHTPATQTPTPQTTTPEQTPEQTPSAQSLVPFISPKNVHAYYIKKGMQSGEVHPRTDLWVISAKGLVCDFCAQSLIAVIEGEPFTNGIDVDLKNKLIAISLRPEHTLTPRIIQKLITDAGYDTDTIELYPPSNPLPTLTPAPPSAP